MTYFPQTTRSEVVHLYDLKKAGFDGMVISDETAIGQAPEWPNFCRIFLALKCKRKSYGFLN